MSAQRVAPGWLIASGHFFFRARNAVFPTIFAVVALVMRPQFIGSPRVHQGLIVLGVVVALAGQAMRLITIGYEYIERGGKEGKVYASRLVQGGVYGLTRNPMYVGNALIAIGMTMAISAPLGYVTLIPFFVLIYAAIIAAEERYLREKFGAEYEAYCARVPRLLPSIPQLCRLMATTPYDWRTALRKDLSTVTGLSLGLIVVPLWRTWRLEGVPAARAQASAALIGASVVLGLYWGLHQLKKRRLLFYLPDSPSS